MLMIRTATTVGAIAALPLFLVGASARGGTTVNRSPAITLRTAQCAIRIDRRTGALLGIENAALGDQVLKDGPGGPFRIHADFGGEFLLDTDPETAANAHISPRDMAVTSVRTWETSHVRRARIVSRGGGFQCELSIALFEGTGESEWTLRVTNIGERTRSAIIDFPRIEGVHPGATGARDLETHLDQAGEVVDAWSRPGGIYGNGFDWSMQWHAIYDPAGRSSLGMIVEDPNVVNKRLVLARPDIAVRCFPPREVAPGESITLPTARLLVGENGWKQTARAYAKWYRKAFHPVRPPRWAAESDVVDGRHFKKWHPGATPDYGAQFVLDSFRELPAATLQMPYDNTEYAFWTRGSMLYGKHTDGDNVVREDLGGWQAMRDGIAGLHKLGLHATLYIEGYIVAMESDPAREGKAERWSVMHRDGSITGGYTSQGFYHMCPGCVEWQDHLVAVVKRVLKQTGADGIRLDSLGFYFLPCYNPEHHHETPFGYNQWISQLLAKVRKAALEINPNALLTTEGPVDFYGRWFHGALDQVYPLELPPMRLAVGPYRPFVYSPAGPVWGSLSGFSGGVTEPGAVLPGANWMCAQAAVHDTIVWGDVADDDPRATDPAVLTRRYTGPRCDVVVAARCEPPALPRRVCADLGLSLAPCGTPYRVDVPLDGAPAAALCDLTTLTWRAVRPETRGGHASVEADSSWVMAVIPHGEERVVTFDAMPEVAPGGVVVIRPETLVGPREPAAIAVTAPGLTVTRARTRTGEEVRIRVPANALPGWYSVRITGKHVLGARRLLHVVR